MEVLEALEGGRDSGVVVRRCGEGVVRDKGLKLCPTTVPCMLPLELHLGLPSIVVIVGRGECVVGVGGPELFFKPEGGVV